MAISGHDQPLIASAGVLWMLNHQHRTLAVVDQVVADRTKKGAPDLAQATGAHHHQSGSVTLLQYAFAWTGSSHTLHFATQLWDDGSVTHTHTRHRKITRPHTQTQHYCTAFMLGEFRTGFQCVACLPS